MDRRTKMLGRVAFRSAVVLNLRKYLCSATTQATRFCYFVHTCGTLVSTTAPLSLRLPQATRTLSKESQLQEQGSREDAASYHYSSSNRNKSREIDREARRSFSSTTQFVCWSRLKTRHTSLVVQYSQTLTTTQVVKRFLHLRKKTTGVSGSILLVATLVQLSSSVRERV